MEHEFRPEAAGENAGDRHAHPAAHVHQHGHKHHGHDDHRHDDHAHGHHDHGHGGHHHHVPSHFGRAFAVGMGLNVAYILAEVVWGLRANALALLADAGHNLSDVLGLGAAWLASVLAARSPSARFTYGLKRSTILSALGNAVLLMLVTGAIAWESIGRLIHPAPVQGWTVTIVAALGILVNGGTALLLMRGSADDINLRGAFLHMAYDALLAAAVVVTGGVIALTGLTWLDPVVSLVVSAVIVGGTWSLLRASLDMALDAVPARIDPAAVVTALLALDHVQDVHHLHVWPLSTTEVALTVHLRVSADAPQDVLLQDATRLLRTRFNIAHPTLQIERSVCVGEIESCAHDHAGGQPACAAAAPHVH